MSRSAACLVLTFLSVFPLKATGAEQTAILVWVGASSWVPSEPGTAATEAWGQESHILNGGPAAIQLGVDDLVPAVPGLGCRPERMLLPPGETSRLAFFGHAEGGMPPVILIQVRASDSIILTDELTRTRQTCDGDNPNCQRRELGRAPLPVFDGKFPARSTALAGAVGLGNKNDPITRRRLNITLANYGESPATFRITVHPLHTAPGNAITSFDQVVPARDVLQLNDVRFDWGNAPTGENSSDKVWVSVTADQPYLFYVSTVLVQQDPGTMPFEVLKPTLLPGPLP